MIENIERPNVNSWFHGDKTSYHKSGQCSAACYDQQRACVGWEPPISEKQVCLHKDYDCNRCYSQKLRELDDKA